MRKIVGQSIDLFYYQIHNIFERIKAVFVLVPKFMHLCTSSFIIHGIFDPKYGALCKVACFFIATLSQVDRKSVFFMIFL